MYMIDRHIRHPLIEFSELLSREAIPTYIPISITRAPKKNSKAAEHELIEDKNRFCFYFILVLGTSNLTMTSSLAMLIKKEPTM